MLLLRSDVQRLATLTRCHTTYIDHLVTRLGKEAALELLVDATAAPSVSRARTTLQAAFAGVRSFLFTDGDIRTSFAAVRAWPSPERHDSSHNRLKGGDVVDIWWAGVQDANRHALGANVADRLTSFLIHEPSLALWARDRRRQSARPALPPHVWVVEDDTVFLGDLRQSLALYRRFAPTADYVSTFANLEGHLEAASHDWKANRAFGRAYANRRVHKWEHVERFSARLIERLDELLSRDGAAAHGEMFASTVCAAEPWCTSSDLRLPLPLSEPHDARAAGVVPRDARMYGPSASVLTTASRGARRRLYEAHRAGGAPGVWLHSVKNYCNALMLASNGTVRARSGDDAAFVVGRLLPGDDDATTAPSAAGAAAAAAGTVADAACAGAVDQGVYS